MFENMERKTEMKKITKIFAFFMAILMCFGILNCVNVYAEESNTDTETDKSALLEGQCLVTIKLKDFDTDETDDIVIEFKNKETGTRKQTTFKKSENWIATVYLEPGKHNISFYTAKNKREIELKEEVLNVADAKTASVELNVKKIINNNFLPKFLRNNMFTLLLLIASTICYLVLKKKREMGIK